MSNEICGDDTTENYSNDGIIAAKESVWGKHLINFDADHFELIGMRPDFSAKEIFNLYSSAVKYYDPDFKKTINI